jgi:drug/metabolite transporter (DMT)-like permease
VAVKVASAGISPALQAGLRSIGSGALLVTWARWRGVQIFVRDGTLGPGIAAGLLFAVEFLVLFWGLSLTTASRGVIFLYTAPFAMAVGAHYLLPGDRLTRPKTIGLLVAFAGILVAFADGLRQPTHRQLLGDLLCFAGALSWAATTIMVKGKRLSRVSPERILLYQLAVSAAVLPLASLVTREEGFRGVTPLVVAALAYQIAIVAFASYAAWFWLVARYPTSRLASFTFLTPVFGVAFGGLFLGERLGPGLLAAVALVGAGIYLVNRPTRPD